MGKWIRARARHNLTPNLEYKSSKQGELYVKVGRKWIRLTYKGGGGFLMPTSLKTNQKVDVNILRTLGMESLIDAATGGRLSTSIDETITILNDVGTETNDDNTRVKQLDDSVSNVIETAKGIPMRDLLGLDQALKTIRGSLMVQEGKRVELQTSIDRWEDVLKNNPSDKENLERDIRKAKEQLVPIHESIDILKGKLKSQLTAIKETLYRLLDKNLSLREKIATLFREQGITIFSVLTAIGMTIGFLVELLLPGGAPPPLPPPPPSSQGGIQEWLKRQLDAIGKLLARLASKFGAALPGILGSIVSWLLSTLGKTVVWLGEHLWVIGMLVVGFLWNKLQTS